MNKLQLFYVVFSSFASKILLINSINKYIDNNNVLDIIKYKFKHQSHKVSWIAAGFFFKMR